MDFNSCSFEEWKVFIHVLNMSCLLRNNMNLKHLNVRKYEDMKQGHTFQLLEFKEQKTQSVFHFLVLSQIKVFFFFYFSLPVKVNIALWINWIWSDQTAFNETKQTGKHIGEELCRNILSLSWSNSGKKNSWIPEMMHLRRVKTKTDMLVQTGLKRLRYNRTDLLNNKTNGLKRLLTRH